MPKQHYNNEPHILVTMMQFIIKLADGGQTLIYTGAGVFIIMMYSFFLCMKWEIPVLVLIIGVGLCLTGLLFFFLTRKKYEL